MDQHWKVADALQTALEDLDRVVVRIVAGEVTVTAGESPFVDVVRESGSDVEVTLRGGVLTIAQPDVRTSPLERLINMFASGDKQRCRVAVTAPPSCAVDISAVSAPVVASGFEGGTRIKTVSGDVTLKDLSTDVDVKTVSGDVEAKGIAASLRLKTVSGDVAVVDGACRRVDTKSVSGDVLLDLDLEETGAYDISTVSGDVSVRTIVDPDLLVEAQSISGDLVTDFGLGWESKPGRRYVRDTIGSGGARLFVKTVSGDLRVLRGRAAA